MTTVKIIETGKIETLEITDPSTGIDWSSDLLGNYDAFDGYDDDAEIDTMSQEAYDWWAELLPRYQAAQEAVEEYRKSLDDDGEFIEHLSHATGCDLEDVPSAMIDAIEWHRGR